MLHRPQVKWVLAVALVLVLLIGGVSALPFQQTAHTTDALLLTQDAIHSTQIAAIQGTVDAHLQATPATVTRTPSPIAPTITLAPNTSYSPTPEGAPGLTRTPLTAVPTLLASPTRTPAPTQPGTTPVPTADPFYWEGCAPDGDFEAFAGYTIPRRSSRARLADNAYPNPVTDARTENVCVGSLWTDGDGYTWVQVATNRPEYFAISRTVGNTVVPNGVLHVWGATHSPFTVEGNRILLDGQPFRFTGVNFRELIGYDNRIMPYANPSDIAIQLDGAKALGMRVVRFYVAHKSLSAEAAIPRIKTILAMLEARGLYGILVLTDGVHSGFQIADTPTNRTASGADRYSHTFFAGGFRSHYLPYVETVTAAIGAHPAIFAWEPGNEFTTVSVPPSTAQMDAFLNFYTETAAVIRRNSPGKLISSGLESCWQLFVLHAYDGERYCARLYQIVDIGTLHTYQTNEPLGSAYQHVLRELQLTDVPLIIEETNTFWEYESADWFNSLIRLTMGRLSGYMQWGMSFPYARDIGVGDGVWNAPTGTAQARRWHILTGFWRALSDQLRNN